MALENSCDVHFCPLLSDYFHFFSKCVHFSGATGVTGDDWSIDILTSYESYPFYETQQFSVPLLVKLIICQGSFCRKELSSPSCSNGCFAGPKWPKLDNCGQKEYELNPCNVSVRNTYNAACQKFFFIILTRVSTALHVQL